MRNMHRGVFPQKKKKLKDPQASVVLSSATDGRDFSYGSFIMNDIISSNASVNNPTEHIFRNQLSTAETAQKYFALITASSVMGNPSYASNVTATDASLSFQLAKLLFGLSFENKEKLSTILGLILKKIETDHQISLSNIPLNNAIPTKLLVPTNINDVRSKYTEGVNSYISKLSIPVFVAKNQFQYCHVHHCLNFLFQNQIPIQAVLPHDGNKVTYLYECKKAQTILTKANTIHHDLIDVVLYIKEWSDSFEPNTSTKSNRGSVHVKSITFECPVDSNVPIQFYTFPICIGPSKANRNAVEKLFLDDLNDFLKTPAKQFYNPVLQKNVRVHLELLLSMQDQPERRSVHSLMMGNSLYTPQWSLSLNWTKAYKQLKSCCHCQESLLNHSFDNTIKCELCCNWNVHDNLIKLKFQAPIDYPQNDMNPIDNDNQILPTIIDHKLLIRVCTTSHEKVASNEWTEKQARSLMRVFGINKETSDSMIEYATNASTLKYIQDNNCADEYQYLVNLHNKHPEQFCMYPINPVWMRSIELIDHIETVMHLLFLGIAKTIFLDIQEWLKKRGCFTDFLRSVNEYTKPVAEINIQWCKIITYGSGKFGGHVSENYLAMVRISLWFYRTLSSYVREPFVEPCIPQRLWTKKTNVEWLRIRGIDTTGLKDDVKERVAMYMSDPDNIPPIKEADGGDGKDIEKVLTSFLSMVSFLLEKTIDEQHIVICERKIKSFLNNYAAFDVQLNQTNNNEMIPPKVQANKTDNQAKSRFKGPTTKKRKVVRSDLENNNRTINASKKKSDEPSWVSKYNFLSLLNLPRQMRNFGPLLNNWEGGVSGEALIGSIKPVIKNGLSKNWQKTTMNRVWKKRVLQLLDGSMDAISESLNTKRKDLYTANYKRMSSFPEIYFAFRNCHPFVAEYKDDSFYIISKESISYRIEHLMFMEISNGAPYHKFCFRSNTAINLVITNTQECLFLPLGNQYAENSHAVVYGSYYVVFSDWKVFNQDGKVDYA
jgi:hypothetical protein